MRRRGQKRSPETRAKIAAGNRGKTFTPERRRKISEARIRRVTESELDLLQELWSLRGLNPKVITRLVGLSKRAYDRAVIDHCTVTQVKFMPSDMEPDELRTLVDLAQQGCFVGNIAKKLSRSRKQVIDCVKRMGFVPVTRNSDRWNTTISKLEQGVIDALRTAGVELTQQYVIDNFVFDAYVANTNIVIEVHGDYWHCNPAVYTTGAINEMQRAMMRRDFCKLAVAKRHGYVRLIVWESDVRRDIERTIRELKEKIKSHEDARSV